jgi:hypothetical protein
MYLSSLISKEGQETHNVISFIFVRAIAMLSEKSFDIVEASKKLHQKRQHEKRSKDEEEGRVLRDITDWISRLVTYYTDKVKNIKDMTQSTQNLQDDINLSMTTSKLSTLLSLHKKPSAALSVNKLASCLESMKTDIYSERQNAILNKEKAELSDKSFKYLQTDIHSAIMRREAEANQLRARE